MKRGKNILFIFLITILSFSCAGNEGILREVGDVIKRSEGIYSPDKRLSVFKISAEVSKGEITLSGETTEKEAVEMILREIDLSIKGYKVRNEIVVLPHPDLGRRIFAIVRVSVANFRKEPLHRSELVTQSLMGSKVTLLKRVKGWYYGQLEDKYLGWVNSDALVIGDSLLISSWEGRRKVMVTSNSGSIYRKPSMDAQPVGDLVRGALMAVFRESEGWIEVELPDGRRGFVKRENLMDLNEFLEYGPPDGYDIVQTAGEFMGTPYLWGGTSAKGFDCSGFTQTVFRLNRILLPRDANQQVNVGNEVNPGENYKNVKPGDLLFFGEKPGRITHCAIYIGDERFIHLEGLVKINSLNPEDSLFHKYRKDTLQKIKRIINYD